MAEIDKTVYTFCGVLLGNKKIFHYRTDDMTLEIGDIVVVPVGVDNRETTAEIVTVEKHRRMTAPYLVDKTKMILRKA